MDDTLENIGRRIEDGIRAGRFTIEDLEHTLEMKTISAVRKGGKFVRQHPWESVGVMAGLGILVGVLIARR
jgi:ElaB/YqjD/DUF883 family membrane-anchored ribosome-binding protein